MQLELWWKGTLASSDSFKQRPSGLFEKKLAYELTNSCSDIEVADCPACSRSCYLPFVFVICFYVCIYDKYCFLFVFLLLFCCMWGCWLCGPTSALVRRLPPLRHSSAIRAIHPDISTPTQICTLLRKYQCGDEKYSSVSRHGRVRVQAIPCQDWGMRQKK